MNKVLKTNRDLTNETASTKKTNPHAESKDFTRKRTQATESNSANCIFFAKTNDFTDLKKENKLKYDYHHLRCEQEIYGII